jgi:hypothetical protein
MTQFSAQSVLWIIDSEIINDNFLLNIFYELLIPGSLIKQFSAQSILWTIDSEIINDTIWHNVSYNASGWVYGKPVPVQDIKAYKGVEV